MFVLYKLIKQLVLPAGLIAVGLAAALLLVVKRKNRLAAVLLAVILALYYLLSIEPTAHLLARTLERQYPAVSHASTLEGADVIVILAGGADKSGKERPFEELNGASWRRLWRGIELYRALDGNTPILYSGGSGDPFDTESHEAELARKYAVSMGIPEERFWVETESRNTAESGAAVRQILDERFPEQDIHKMILVTSAVHMPRAVAVMDRHGIKTIPMPADFSAKAILRVSPLSFLPQAGHLESSSASIHEWLGMAAYWALARFEGGVLR